MTTSQQLALLGVADLAEYDTVRITGTASSPDGKRYQDLEAGISTISEDGYIKVWPADGRDGGKIWFPLCDIERLEVLED